MQTVTAIVVTRYVDIIQGRMHCEVFIRNCKGYRLSDEPALICDPWIFHFFLFVVDQKLAEQTEVIIKADTVSRPAKRCGITKHITWHQSRHTAATTVFLSNGVPIETVSSMLGHKSIKTTQIYAKITKEKLNQDMENLAARLNQIEEFAGCTI